MTGALLALLALGMLGTDLARPAAGADARPGIRVLQVEGLLDPMNVELIGDAIRDANERSLTMLVVQLDSPGAVADVDDLVTDLRRSEVPVVVWVGPSGAEARGGAAVLVEAAHRAYVSQGSSVGPAHPLRLDDPDAAAPAVERLRDLAELRGRDAAGAELLATERLDARRAAQTEAVDGLRPTVGETIVKLDGQTVETAAGDVELSTAKVIGEGRGRRRQPNQDVVFAGLDLGGQVRHWLVSPSTAYFLLVAGLALVAFEFFAASIGFAAAVGGVAVLGAGYGFSYLPVRWWAVALLVVSTIGFSIDAQAGGLGFWTGVGAVTMVAGSVLLYGGASELRPEWWLVVLVAGGAILFYGFAIPSFIRARFSSPTLGREGMIGELGVAEVPVDPDGVVVVRGARWRARTNRATPLAAGATARVVAVEGLVLEVEPETGGARDHRERGRRPKS